MVAVNESRAAELQALIEEQAADAAAWHVRQRGITTIDLDRLPDARGGIRLIEGRAHEWGVEDQGMCAVCRNDPGFAVCIKCGRDATGIVWRGKPVTETGGPTTYDPAGSLKGGVGG